MTFRSTRGITLEFLSSAFAMATMLVISNVLFAHDGPQHGDSEEAKGSRTWTLGDEGVHLHGTFVTASDENVQIRRDDNRLVTIKIERLVTSDRAWIASRLETIETLNQQRQLRFVVQNPPNSDGIQAQENTKPMPVIYEHFQPFSNALKLRWDDEYFYVGSNGMPNHPDKISEPCCAQERLLQLDVPSSSVFTN